MTIDELIIDTQKITIKVLQAHNKILTEDNAALNAEVQELRHHLSPPVETDLAGKLDAVSREMEG